jgi:3-oxoadipate enol-lactonase
MGASLGATLAMWKEQLPLAERLRLVRFDHRGHGRSPTPPGPYEIADLGHDVLELMDMLEIERAYYCGLSLGGMVGMWLGINASARIDRLVLLCTAAHMAPASAWQERAATVLAAGSPSRSPTAWSIAGSPRGSRLPTPRSAPHLRSMLAAAPAEGYAACCGAIERMDLRPELRRIRAPTLVISGAGDLAAPVDRQALIAAAIPGARHEVIEPGAHVAAVERPDIVNQLIEEHLS